MIIRCYFLPPHQCSALSLLPPPRPTFCRPQGNFPPAPTISDSPTGASSPSFPDHAISPHDGSLSSLPVMIAGHHHQQQTIYGCLPDLLPPNWLKTNSLNLSDWLIAPDLTGYPKSWCLRARPVLSVRMVVLRMGRGSRVSW